MKNNLKNAISDYYKGISLSRAQIEQLHSVLDASDYQIEKKFSFRNHWLIPATCGFLLAMSISVILYLNSIKPLNEKISGEVAYNHSKAMPPEVITDDYTVLNQALDKLGFTAKPSSLLPPHLQLVGGRYCSVLGNVAAQLKLRDATTMQEYTLYQFKAENMEDLSKTPVLLNERGTQVKIWREENLGFALAK